ncbi:MAG TPA: hypothetical protein VL126_10405, partial [Bacteroidota bacterium]|nr:hypothetical protein [Bacteroidota bacterium]
SVQEHIGRRRTTSGEQKGSPGPAINVTTHHRRVTANHTIRGPQTYFQLIPPAYRSRGSLIERLKYRNGSIQAS